MPTEAETVRATAETALAALATHDMAKLATVAHSVRGIRFSPYPSVRPGADRTLSRADLPTAWTDPKRYVWGIADGSGSDISLTFAEYFARFVFDRDYRAAPKSRYSGAPIGTGNSVNNIATAYPNARWIEYHFPGVDPKYTGMDWSSLWLVFEPDGQGWGLVGIVHGNWTI